MAIIWRSSDRTTDDGRQTTDHRRGIRRPSSVVRPLSSGSRPPTHLVDWRAGAPVHGLAANDKALLFVKANCAGIVLVDVKIETLRRYPLCFSEQGGGHARSPSFRRYDDLIEIETAWIDGDESDHLTVRFGHRDGRHRDELVTPALPPPFEPRREIDGGIGELPGPPPQLDRCVLVGGPIGAKRERQVSHCLTGEWVADVLALTARSA